MNNKVLEAEGLYLSDLRLDGGKLCITVNGKDYCYVPVSGFTPEEVFEKYNKIKKYSEGRAYAWLKKNTQLSSNESKKSNKEIAMSLLEIK